jgi:hypothetical protein
MSFGVDRGTRSGVAGPLGDVLRASEAVRDLDPARLVDEELKTDLLLRPAPVA